MNPACDLAERHDGNCNTDRALLFEIQKINNILPKGFFDIFSKSKQKELEQIYKNTKSGYYHWLPKVHFFDGGVINFRRIKTCTENELICDFDSSITQVSPAFLKDMVSRFSSYYARQGQPDIDHDKMKTIITSQKVEAS